MSHFATPSAASVDTARRPLPLHVLRAVFAVASVAAAAALLATALQPSSVPVQSPPAAAPASGASPMAAGSGGVPDAATVFRGRDLAPEEQPPTF